MQLPATPIDTSRIHAQSSQYRLLSDAATVIPPDVTVRVWTLSRDKSLDVQFYRLAVALLPNMTVLSSAHSNAADYVVVATVGAPPDNSIRLPGYRVIKITPLGTILVASRR